MVGVWPLSPSDGALRTRLERLGYSVEVTLAPALGAGGTEGKAIVVVSESATSTDVNTKLCPSRS